MFPYIHIVLSSYTVMAFIGCFFSLMFLYCRFEKYGLTFKEFIKLFLTCSFTCFLGSKLLYFIVAWMESKNSVPLAQLPLMYIQSGYVFYGGLFGAIGGIFLYAKYIPHATYRDLTQMAAPAFPLFHGFGRIGCMLAGCCYGVKLSSPIVLFDVLQVNLFPTQLLESIYEFFLFIVLYFIGKSKYEANIDLLRCYLLCYAVFRFVIEFYRADMDRGIWFDMSTSQWISSAIVLFYTIDYMRRFMKFKRMVRN